MKDINNISSDYLCNIIKEKVDVKIGVYSEWNSMTREDRCGWYEARQEEFRADDDFAKRSLEKMISDLIGDNGYDGMAEACHRFITDEHIQSLVSIINDITRGPAFLAFEEFGDMVDPDILVKTEDAEVE